MTLNGVRLGHHFCNMEKLMLNKIVLSEELTLPIKCDLYLLDVIQQRYGTVVEFERQLVGIKMDENGQETLTEPSISAITFALPLMIAEGMDIAGEKNKNAYPRMTDKQIISSITRNYRAIAEDMHLELKRCFEIKK